MSLLHFGPIAFLVLLAQAAPAPKPSAPPQVAPVVPAAVSVRFTLGMKPGETRLIEIQGTSSADVAVTIGVTTNRSKKRATMSYRLVDSMVEPGANAWTGWRRLVRAQESDDGEVSDPELTGLEADVWCTRDSKLNFKTRDGRGVAKSRLQNLLQQAGAFGLHLGLPAELAIGQECDVDFKALAQWCFELDGTATSATAHLKLLSVDAKRNVARLAGSVKVEEKIEQTADDSSDGVASRATGHYEGKVEIDYDLNRQHVVRIACNGKGRVEGELELRIPTHIAVDATVDVTFTAVDGPAAAAALKETPQFRDVPHGIDAAGVVVTLPSHYFKVHVKGDGATRFTSALDGNDRQVGVRVVEIADPGVSLKDEAAAFLKSLAGSNPGLKITESAAVSGLGGGRAFEFVNASSHSLANLLPVSDGRYVLVQFITPPAEWDAHVKEWPRILQALKKQTAKK